MLWRSRRKMKGSGGEKADENLQSVIYVLKGKARMRWGEKLEFTAEAGPGDFIYVPPYVPVCAQRLLVSFPGQTV